jgi:hypothetical protein
MQDFDHPHECPAREVRRRALRRHERQTYAIDGGTDHDFHVVADQRSVY